MINSLISKKVILIIAALGAALIIIFQHGLYSTPPWASQDFNKSVQVDQEVKLVATDPDPLAEATIAPNQAFSLTFNYPLENTGEFKHTFDPPIGHQMKL